MGIHQISVAFDERQDRLLWRISTQEGQEFQFWLTRRLLARWSPVVQTLVERLDVQQTGTVASDAPARQMVSEWRRQHIVEQADFQTPYQPPAQRPLGPEPMLVTDVQMTPVGQELQMVLSDQSGPEVRRCQMRLTTELVHAWQHLVAQALDKAQWAITSPNLLTAPQDEAISPPYRH